MLCCFVLLLRQDFAMSAPSLTNRSGTHCTYDVESQPLSLHFSSSHKMFFSLSIGRGLIWSNGFLLEFALGAFPAHNCFGGRYIRFVDRFDISLEITLQSRWIPIASCDWNISAPVLRWKQSRPKISPSCPALFYNSFPLFACWSSRGEQKSWEFTCWPIRYVLAITKPYPTNTSYIANSTHALGPHTSARVNPWVSPCYAPGAAASTSCFCSKIYDDLAELQTTTTTGTAPDGGSVWTDTFTMSTITEMSYKPPMECCSKTCEIYPSSVQIIYWHVDLNTLNSSITAAPSSSPYSTVAGNFTLQVQPW